MSLVVCQTIAAVHEFLGGLGEIPFSWTCASKNSCTAAMVWHTTRDRRSSCPSSCPAKKFRCSPSSAKRNSCAAAWNGCCPLPQNATFLFVRISAFAAGGLSNTPPPPPPPPLKQKILPPHLSQTG